MIESYNGKSADWQKVNEPRVFHSEIGYDRQGKIKGGAAASCDYADNDRKDYPFNGCYKTFRIMLYLMYIIYYFKIQDHAAKQCVYNKREEK